MSAEDASAPPSEAAATPVPPAALPSAFAQVRPAAAPAASQTTYIEARAMPAGVPMLPLYSTQPSSLAPGHAHPVTYLQAPPQRPPMPETGAVDTDEARAAAPEGFRPVVIPARAAQVRASVSLS